MRRIVLCLLIVFSYQTNADDWVDDWFDNAVYDNGSSYQSQKKGYYMGPSFSARVNTSTDYPVSVTMPKIKSGCGGIDAFAGGMAFLDADFLVEKVQGAMQAAPYIALDMAMKTMCKECSETLAKAEQIANYLNGLQLNECSMAKPMAAMIMNDDPQAAAKTWAESSGFMDAYDGVSRMWTETKQDTDANNGVPNSDLKELTEGCPKEFKDLMSDGSLIDKITTKTGMTEYAPIIRGYIGDVKIHADLSQKIPTSELVMRCAENKNASLDDMLNGKSFIQDRNGTCRRSAQRPVKDIVRDKLIAISNKLTTGTVLTADEEKFIFSTKNIPVYTIMIQGITNDTISDDIEALTSIIAIGYTHMIYQDLYRNILYSFVSARNVAEKPGHDTVSGSKPCDVSIYSGAMTNFKRLIEISKDERKTLTADYRKLLQEQITSESFNRIFQSRNERIFKKQVSKEVIAK